jgi:hypothetical protein
VRAMTLSFGHFLVAFEGPIGMVGRGMTAAGVTRWREALSKP